MGVALTWCYKMPINLPQLLDHNLILSGSIPEVPLIFSEFVNDMNRIFLGISRTEPQVTWFESDIEAALWQAGAGNAAFTTVDDFAHLWPRSEIIGRIAEERNFDAIAHVRTENVATDMLKISEALGYGKLQYWGILYGSVLGNTYGFCFHLRVNHY